MKHAKRSGFFTLAWSIATLALALTAGAETSTWAGASGANWDTPASWTGVNTPPLATDDALFNLSTRTVAITTTPGISNITVSGSGVWTWSGVGMLTLNGLFSYGSSGASTFSSALTGPGSLSVDNGTLTLSGNNTFTGTITVQAGKTLNVSAGYNNTPSEVRVKTGGVLAGNSNIIPVAGPLVLENDSRVHKNDANWNVGTRFTNSVTMAGDRIYLGFVGNAKKCSVKIEGPFVLGGGGTAKALYVESGDVNNHTTISGAISGENDLLKDGVGTLVVNSTNNTYSGKTIVKAGMLSTGYLGFPLGTSTDPVQVGYDANDATLRVSGNTTTSSQAFRDIRVMAGAGKRKIWGSGWVQNLQNLILEKDAYLDTDYSDGLIFNGVVSGTGDVYVVSTKGAGNDVNFYGTANNTYLGKVYIDAADLHLGKSAGTNAITGDVTVGDGSGAAVLLLINSDQIADTGMVKLASTGQFDLNGKSEKVAGLVDAFDGKGQVLNSATAASTLTLGPAAGQTNVFGGGILHVATKGAVSLVKTNDGVQVLSGTNTYAGTTRIYGGALLVNGVLSAAGAGVTAYAGGAFGGSGIVSQAVVIAASACLAPGNNGAGTLTVNSLTLAAGSTNRFELGAVDASDKVVVKGNLTLGGEIKISALEGLGQFTYDLLTYTGTLSLDGTPTVVVPEPYRGTLVTDVPNKVQVSIATTGGTLIMFQ